MSAAAVITQQSGGIRRPSADLVALTDEVMSVRTCPFAESQQRAVDIATRIQNAEQQLWDAMQVIKRSGT